MNGGSQAVRLPAEFRFQGAREVYIRRNEVSGDIVLSVRPDGERWAEFFAFRNLNAAPTEFMADRPLNEPLFPRESLGGK